MNIENIAFEIISAAGEAFSTVMESITEMRNNKFKEADEMLNKSKELLTIAHQAHSQLLFDFAAGKKIESNILLVHAQDHLTKTEVMVILAEELLFLNKKIKDIKE